MKEHRILIFAGTTEGRRLAEYLLKRQVRVHACVATEYGESLLPEHENLTVSHERMDNREMRELMKEFQPEYVVDATHPYAKEVTENIIKACTKERMKYLRFVREQMEVSGPCVYVDSLEEAVAYLEQVPGKILVTTGSKNLEMYTKLSNYKERVYARVLSVLAGVEKCESLGITGRHMICMQGPFSVEMNVATLREFGIDWMVTKESGVTGGFKEKLAACEKVGAKLVVIGRPEQETGYTFSEMCICLKEKLELKDQWSVSLVGIGMGSADSFTQEARKACDQADLLIGARRMVQAVKESQTATAAQAVYEAYKPEEILAYIKAHPEYERVAVVLSGDVGFYSGAKKLREMLNQEEQMAVHVIPGISSGVYLCAKLGISWEDVHFTSIHGRDCHLISEVREHEKVVVLAGSKEGIQKAAGELTDYGYGELTVAIGSDLSYETEKIQTGRAADFLEYDGNALAVLYIENPEAKEHLVTQGIADSEFIRGNVPMTKEEVRCISITRLHLRKNAIVYDVGAGTGSVSIEMALRASKGQVYAIERKPEAIDLIKKNQRKFKVDNLTVIHGLAPEALEELPAPDCVFIGGSGGSMKKILETVFVKNPKARIVVNAIALETLAEILSLMKEWNVEDEEITQVQISKTKYVADYHMMAGQNPVFVISFTGSGVSGEETAR